MKKIKHELSSIKCYERPAKPDQAPSYQRRILLKSDGELQGCPDDPEPLEVVILKKNDFGEMMEFIEKVESRETSLNDKLTLYQSEIEMMKKEANQFNERIDQLKQNHSDQIKILQDNIKDLKDDKATLQEEMKKTDQDLKNALGWIGLSWGVLQNLKEKSRWQILIGGLDKTAREIPKPSPSLLPANPKNIIETKE